VGLMRRRRIWPLGFMRMLFERRTASQGQNSVRESGLLMEENQWARLRVTEAVGIPAIHKPFTMGSRRSG